MATVTGITAAKAQAIEDVSVVSGTINSSGHLILTTAGGANIDAGISRDDEALGTLQGQIFTVGTKVNQLETQVESVKPSFHGQSASTLTLTSGTDTPIPLSEVFDTDNMHSNSSFAARMICVTPGLYSITGQVGFNYVNSTGYRQAQFLLNGVGPALIVSRFFPNTIGSGNIQYINLSTVVRLEINDYVTLNAYQNCGSNLTLPTITTYAKAIWLSH